MRRIIDFLNLHFSFKYELNKETYFEPWLLITEFFKEFIIDSECSSFRNQTPHHSSFVLSVHYFTWVNDGLLIRLWSSTYRNLILTFRLTGMLALYCSTLIIKDLQIIKYRLCGLSFSAMTSLMLTKVGWNPLPVHALVLRRGFKCFLRRENLYTCIMNSKVQFSRLTVTKNIIGMKLIVHFRMTMGLYKNSG